MNTTLRKNAEIKRIKSEIANQYGAASFEDIDRGNMTSRANGDIIRTLVELSEKQLNK
ncbi:MAG: small, acid-soluble spore protein, alpha/beta type [Eubacteriales bacterium]|nr:small, acid-soluble spore protein, alpha/beta type [Eubacteriales bacterium]